MPSHSRSTTTRTTAQPKLVGEKASSKEKYRRCERDHSFDTSSPRKSLRGSLNESVMCKATAVWQSSCCSPRQDPTTWKFTQHDQFHSLYLQRKDYHDLCVCKFVLEEHFICLFEICVGRTLICHDPTRIYMTLPMKLRTSQMVQLSILLSLLLIVWWSDDLIDTQSKASVQGVLFQWFI